MGADLKLNVGHNQAEHEPGAGADHGLGAGADHGLGASHDDESLYSLLTKDGGPQRDRAPGLEDQMQTLRHQLFRRLWHKGPQFLRDEAQIRRTLRELVVEEGASSAMIDILMKDIFGFGPISELMNDPLVTDIWIDSYNRIYFEREGRVQPWRQGFPSEEALRRFIIRLASASGRKVDEARPVEDFRLPDGSRMVVFLDGVSVRGTSAVIRRFARLFTLEELAERELFPPGMIRLFRLLVKARINILAAGGMGSGKNTMLYAMLLSVGRDEKIVFVEDPAETRVGLPDTGHPGLPLPRAVVYEPRRAGVEGEGEVSMELLGEKVLRTKPTRVIYSECRNALTAYWTLQAMNLGHPGSMSTLHADSPEEVPLRLADMLASYPGGAYSSLEARAGKVASAEVILFLGQINGHRRLLDIAEIRRGRVDQLPGVVPLYSFEIQDFRGDGAPVGLLKATGAVPVWLDHRKLLLYLTRGERAELRAWFDPNRPVMSPAPAPPAPVRESETGEAVR